MTENEFMTMYKRQSVHQLQTTGGMIFCYPSFTSVLILAALLNVAQVAGSSLPSCDVYMRSLPTTTVAIPTGECKSGTIPAEIGRLTNLQSLNLDNSDLTGSIPAQIGLLSNLVQVILVNNNLTGAIPATFEFLALKVLYLSGNRLGGVVPSLRFLVLGDVSPGERLEYSLVGQSCVGNKCTTSDDSCNSGVCCAKGCPACVADSQGIILGGFFSSGLCQAGITCSQTSGCVQVENEEESICKTNCCVPGVKADLVSTCEVGSGLGILKNYGDSCTTLDSNYVCKDDGACLGGRCCKPSIRVGHTTSCNNLGQGVIKFGTLCDEDHVCPLSSTCHSGNEICCRTGVRVADCTGCSSDGRGFLRNQGMVCDVNHICPDNGKCRENCCGENVREEDIDSCNEFGQGLLKSVGKMCDNDHVCPVSSVCHSGNKRCCKNGIRTVDTSGCDSNGNGLVKRVGLSCDPDHLCPEGTLCHPESKRCKLPETARPSQSPTTSPTRSTKSPTTSPTRSTKSPTTPPTTSPSADRLPETSKTNLELWSALWQELDKLLDVDNKPPCAVISNNPCACVEFFEREAYTSIEFQCTTVIQSVMFVNVGFSGPFPETQMNEFLSDTFVEKVVIRGDENLKAISNGCARVPACMENECIFEGVLICPAQETPVVVASFAGVILFFWIILKLLTYCSSRNGEKREFDLLEPVLLDVLDIVTDVVFGIQLVTSPKKDLQSFGIAVFVFVAVALFTNVLLCVQFYVQNDEFSEWKKNHSSVSKFLLMLTLFSPEVLAVTSSNIFEFLDAGLSRVERNLLIVLGTCSNILEDIPMVYIVVKTNEGFQWSPVSTLTLATSVISLGTGLLVRRSFAFAEWYKENKVSQYSSADKGAKSVQDASTMDLGEISSDDRTIQVA